MKQNRLPSWLFPVLILVGLGLLITGGISYFVALRSPADNPEVSNPEISSISPTSTTLPAPSATATDVAPTLTPTLKPMPTSTQTEEPAVSEETTIPTPTQSTDEGANLSLPPKLVFDGHLAYEQVLAQVAFGPRPTGSEAGWATGDFIIAELNKMGWQAEPQEFLFMGVQSRNIIGHKEGSSGPVIIISAHYDTRPAADQDPDPTRRGEPIEGGNDGASGVAVLLELARVLNSEKLKNDVWLAFFDAEDRGRLDGWPFSVGARYMAENLTVNPQSVVVLDMIGDADQQLYYEQNSTAELSKQIWAVAAELGYEANFIPEFKYTIIDDHLPFLERLIPAVDIIDFDYAYWHTVEDTADKVSPESLERVGRTLQVWLEEKQ